MQNLPAGVSNAPVGDEKWQQELIANFIIAVVTGILLVFAVLVLLYRRFVSPLVNMTSLLLAPLGGLLALVDRSARPLSMLGVHRHADAARHRRQELDPADRFRDRGNGKAACPRSEAIIDAGHKRAQPIVMTTVAMIAGMIPTALSLSGDGAWRAPMGTTVIGGLLLSTLLTLMIVPAGFSLADGLEKRLGPWLRNRILTYQPGDDRAGQAEAYPAE